MRNTMAKYALLFTLFLSVIGFSVQAQNIERGVAYRTTGDAYALQQCRVDISYASTAEPLLPVIVWFHGGGLTSGGREIPKALIGDKYVVVAVSYRLSPTVSVEDIIDDAAAAVSWTFENISKYGGDTTKIYIAGHSAGGYLVEMIGLDRSYLAKYGHSADSLAAIIPFSGQAITHFEQRRAMGMSPYQPLIDTLAPLYHVRGDAPPILLITGDREQELYGRYEETAYFWRMLRLAGHKDVELLELDGFDHGDMANPAFDLLKKYIDKRER